MLLRRADRSDMRLDRYVGHAAGIGRSNAKRAIRQGLVSVEGLPDAIPETDIDPDSVRVTYNGALLEWEEHVYLMMNKPAGYVTAVSDRKEETVTRLIPEKYASRVHPVGRLDKDTEGLLLLTDDGDLTHSIISPQYHVPKTYYCELVRDISEEDLDRLRRGVDIGDDKLTRECSAEYAEGRDRIFITISEGRFHQIKRMLYAVDNELRYLKRLSVGNILLGDLEPGHVRKLTHEELSSLKEYRKSE